MNIKCNLCGICFYYPDLAAKNNTERRDLQGRLMRDESTSSEREITKEERSKMLENIPEVK